MFDFINWIYGVHIMLGAWVLLGYVIWREISSDKQTGKWTNIRIIISCIITLVILRIAYEVFDKKLLAVF